MRAKFVRRVRKLCRSFVSCMGVSASGGRGCFPNFVHGAEDGGRGAFLASAWS